MKRFPISLALVTWIAIAFLYTYTVTRRFQGFPELNPAQYFYHRLTDAFLQGSLSFLEKPPPELLALSDPYETALNLPITRDTSKGLWDLSLYNGKLYMYFGVVPVIILFLPYRLITNHHLPEGAAVLLFCFGAFFFSTALLLRIRRKFFASTPAWMIVFALAVMAVSSWIPELLSTPSTYTIPVACGLFFLFGGFYFLSKACETPSPRIRFLGFASLFFGLAVGGRPHYVLGGFIALGSTAWVLYQRLPWREMSKALLCIVLPFEAVIFSLCIYNFLRFDDLLEFGIHHQLTLYNPHLVNYLSSSRIGIGAFFLTFQPLLLIDSFPYVFATNDIPSWLQLPNPYLVEWPVGILVGFPFLWTIASSLAVIWWKRRNAPLFPRFEFTMITGVGILIFIVLTTMIAVIDRYTADFALHFAFSAILLWFYSDLLLAGDKKLRLLNQVVGLILGLGSIYIGAALYIIPLVF